MVDIKKYSFLVKSAAWAASSVALILMLTKLLTWWHTGSVSMLASLIDSSLDLLASITNLVILHYALQPADKEHLFGHGKAESLAALAQATFITGSAFFLLLNGATRIYYPQELTSPEFGVYMSVAATVITGVLISYQSWVVKQTSSQATAADMLHYKTDFILNITVMFALLLTWRGFPKADPIFAIFVSLYILYSAFNLAKTAIQSLLDHQLPIEEQKQFLTTILKHEKVRGCHDFRTRQGGATRFLQCHIELDDNLNLLEAHTIADQVENSLNREFNNLDVIIHIDPISVVPLEKRMDVQVLAKDLLR